MGQDRRRDSRQDATLWPPRPTGAWTVTYPRNHGSRGLGEWWHTEVPTRNRMAPPPGMPDFYREHLQRRWADGCQNGLVLMAEIQALGYVGCDAGLAKLLAPWRVPV